MTPDLTAENARLREEVARLTLEPFEELADEGNEDQPDETKVIVHAGRSICYWLTLADLRRVRAILAKPEVRKPLSQPDREG